MVPTYAIYIQKEKKQINDTKIYWRVIERLFFVVRPFTQPEHALSFNRRTLKGFPYTNTVP